MSVSLRSRWLRRGLFGVFSFLLFQTGCGTQSKKDDFASQATTSPKPVATHTTLQSHDDLRRSMVLKWISHCLLGGKNCDPKTKDYYKNFFTLMTQIKSGRIEHRSFELMDNWHSLYEVDTPFGRHLTDPNLQGYLLGRKAILANLADKDKDAYNRHFPKLKKTLRQLARDWMLVNQENHNMSHLEALYFNERSSRARWAAESLLHLDLLSSLQYTTVLSEWNKDAGQNERWIVTQTFLRYRTQLEQLYLAGNPISLASFPQDHWSIVEDHFRQGGFRANDFRKDAAFSFLMAEIFYYLSQLH